MEKTAQHIVFRVSRRLAAGVALTILAVLFFVMWTSYSRAASAEFTPTSCTGDWRDPEKARVSELGSLFDFRDSESSVFEATGQKLFCSFGGATAGEVRAVSSAQLVLHFVPATYIVKEPLEDGSFQPNLEIVGTSTDEVQVFAGATSTDSTAQQESVSADTEPETVHQSEVDTHDTNGNETIDETTLEIHTTVTADPEISVPAESAIPLDEVPQRVPENETVAPEARLPIDWLISIAHAQDTSATLPISAVTLSATSTPPEPPSLTDESRISVAYSVDSTGWKDLGNFEGPILMEEIRIALPLTSAADIETLVIRVSGDALGAEPIYLDGMTLEVVFEEEVPDTTPPESPLLHAVLSEDHTIAVLPVDDGTVFAVMAIDEVVGLYRVADTATGRLITEIAGSAVTSSTTLFLKDGWIMWTPDGDTLHTYDIFSGSRHSARLSYDELEGDTIALIPALPHTVVYRNEEMYFWTPAGAEETADAVSSVPQVEILPDPAPTIAPEPIPVVPTLPPEKLSVSPTHSCTVDPFLIELGPSDAAETRVIFRKSDYIPAQASVPEHLQGVVVQFRGIEGSMYDMPASSALELSAIISVSSYGARPANYTIPIVFMQSSPQLSETICQFNIKVRE